MTHPRQTWEQTALDLWPPLFGFAVQLVRDRARAEDLCQEAYLRLFGMDRDVDASRPLRPLLFCIVRNLVRSELRRERGAPFDDVIVPDSVDDASVDPLTLVGSAEESARVDAALSRMPATWRAALYLRDGLDLSYAEVADILDKTEDVIRVTLHRARLRVRVMLKSQLSERTES